MIYADFESILVAEENGKRNPNESYNNKYQKHITCSYGYKLVCVDDKFSKPFKSYLGEDAVSNFISSMIEESKYCSDVMKKHFNKLVITKEDNKDFENSTKFWICDNDYIDVNVKKRDNCHITRNIQVLHIKIVTSMFKLNHKTPVKFNNLNNFDSHLIMQ